MTRTEASNLNKDIRTALESVLKQYNLTLTRNSLTFGERDVKVNLTMEQLNTDGTHKADDKTEYLLRCALSMKGNKNLPATIVGSKVKTFTGETYIITGYNSRASKYPVEAQRVSDGQMFKLTGYGLQFVA